MKRFFRPDLIEQRCWWEVRANNAHRGGRPDALPFTAPSSFAFTIGRGANAAPAIDATIASLQAKNAAAVLALGEDAPFKVTYPLNFVDPRPASSVERRTLRSVPAYDDAEFISLNEAVTRCLEIEWPSLDDDDRASVTLTAVEVTLARKAQGTVITPLAYAKSVAQREATKLWTRRQPFVAVLNAPIGSEDGTHTTLLDISNEAFDAPSDGEGAYRHAMSVLDALPRPNWERLGRDYVRRRRKCTEAEIRRVQRLRAAPDNALPDIAPVIVKRGRPVDGAMHLLHAALGQRDDVVNIATAIIFMSAPKPEGIDPAQHWRATHELVAASVRRFKSAAKALGE